MRSFLVYARNGLFDLFLLADPVCAYGHMCGEYDKMLRRLETRVDSGIGMYGA